MPQRDLASSPARGALDAMYASASSTYPKKVVRSRRRSSGFRVNTGFARVLLPRNSIAQSFTYSPVASFSLRASTKLRRDAQKGRW